MSNEQFLNNLDKVDRIARYTKLGRLFNNPYKYLKAILVRNIHAKTLKAKKVKTSLFFGDEMTIALPAATDIYLTGGKSHSSEIRLARFLIENLKAGDHFIDIGAHYGYFTLLAAKLVGANGKILSFEPSKDTYEILLRNCIGKEIHTFNEAVSDKNELITFFQFPTMFSEYNSLDIQQFENEVWYKKNEPEKITVKASRLDDIIDTNDIQPSIIKIDVEGAEDKIIRGGEKFLKAHAPIIAMEYLSATRGNTAHLGAATQLHNLEYQSFLIKDDGTLEAISNIDAYLSKNNLESENIIFKKSF